MATDDHAALDAEWHQAFDALRATGVEYDADDPIAARYRTASTALNHSNRRRERWTETDRVAAATDKAALDAINLLLSAETWPGASGMEDVCEIVRSTGRTKVTGAPDWGATLMATETRRVRLYGAEPELVGVAKAALFGELVTLATPVLVSYRSDLFHDAVWIDGLTGPCTLYWSVRATGTCISSDPTFFASSMSVWGERSIAWRIDLVVDHEVWYADFTPYEALSARLVDDQVPVAA